MKLNSSQIRQILNQFDAQVIPEDHPVVNELSQLFGEHTFFLDGTGLNTVEPDDGANTHAQSAIVVNLANWADAQLGSLAPHEPEPTDITVVLATEH
jgi:hypothetical protein